MDKEAYYFSHDANAHIDDKILELRSQYQWEGYGIYWVIIEILRSQSNYSYEMNKLSGLSIAIAKPKDWVKVYLDYCISLELFVENDGEFYSESLMSRMEQIDEKRKKRAEAGRLGGIAKAKGKQNSSNAKAKPSKEKKVKEKKVKEKKIIHLDVLYFTEEEKVKLKQKYPNAQLLKLGLEKLNNYIMSSGKSYKSHYHVMIDWVYEQICGDYVPTGKEIDSSIPKATLEQNSARDALALEKINQTKKGK